MMLTRIYKERRHTPPFDAYTHSTSNFHENVYGHEINLITSPKLIFISNLLGNEKRRTLRCIFSVFVVLP